MSPSCFSRWFRARTGITPHAFVIESRLERAKAMLRDSDRSLLEIALSRGIHEPVVPQRDVPAPRRHDARRIPRRNEPESVAGQQENERHGPPRRAKLAVARTDPDPTPHEERGEPPMSQYHKLYTAGRHRRRLHRPPAADDLRRREHRPRDADQQRHPAREGREGVRRAGRADLGRDRELLRLHLAAVARRLPGPARGRAHLDELLGRRGLPRSDRGDGPQEHPDDRAVDGGLRHLADDRDARRGLPRLRRRGLLRRDLERRAGRRPLPHGAGRRDAPDDDRARCSNGSATGRTASTTTR